MYKLTHIILISSIAQGKFHKIVNFVFNERNERFADDWRALFAIWRLATAFEIIATVVTISTLHRTEFMRNFVTCTLLHKERTIISLCADDSNKTHKRLTFIGYILRNVQQNCWHDTHTSCEVCQDKFHGQRCSTSYLYHYNFSFNGYLLVF